MDTQVPKVQMKVSENMGPEYNTLNSRILIIRTPKDPYYKDHQIRYPFLVGSLSEGPQNKVPNFFLTPRLPTVVPFEALLYSGPKNGVGK